MGITVHFGFLDVKMHESNWLQVSKKIQSPIEKGVIGGEEKIFD
jgi:hypothetical protein